MLFRVLTIIALLAVSVLRCSSNTSGTGGTETTNGMAVVVGQHYVKLCPSIDATFVLSTDTFVTYRSFGYQYRDSLAAGDTAILTELPDGIYTLIAYDPAGNGLAVYSLAPSVATVRTTWHEFAPCGSVTGTVLMPPLSQCYVYVPGTDLFDVVDSTGIFAIDQIPLGAHTLCAECVAQTGRLLSRDTDSLLITPDNLHITTELNPQ